jgi:hypothetical protein
MQEGAGGEVRGRMSRFTALMSSTQ